jgi:hypothetical protein
MKLSRLVLVVLCALPMLSCSDGGECDKCSSDADCTKGGLVCVRFQDGSQRCGSGEGTTQCRVLP